MQNETQPTTEPPNETLELIDLARAIQAWQNDQSPKLSNEAMLKRYPGLGSVKTYTKLITGDASRLDMEGAWLRDYREVKAMTDVAALGKGDDPIYSDLAPAKEVAAHIKALWEGRGNDRILIIQAGTGGGKTKALECAHALIHGSRLITADVMWNLSTSAMIGDLCIGLGGVLDKDREDFDKRTSCAYRSALLKRIIGSKRMLVFIDEAHHLSADGIDFLKGLNNAFKNLYIVLAGMDTLWNRLTSDRWQQAKQLIYNRGMATIHLDPPDAKDATTFLQRRLPGRTLDLGDALKELVAEARQFGAYAFLRRVSKKLLKGTEDIDADILRNAMRLAKKDITTNRKAA